MAKKASKTTAPAQSSARTTPAEPPVAPERRRDWMFGGALFLLAFLLYQGTLSYSYTMDDPLALSANKYVQKGVAGLGDIFRSGYLEGYSGRDDNSYRPLPLAMYALEKSWMGGQVSDHRLVHVFLYALACAMAYFLLRRLKPDWSQWGPACAALLFAVHPLHTEVAANIKSRDELTAFIGIAAMLLGLLAYARKGGLGALLGSVFAFFVATLSKESALPAVLLAPLTLYYAANYSPRRAALSLAWFAPALLAYFALRAAALDGTAPQISILENSLLGAASLSERCASAFALLSRYYQLIVWPSPLLCDYSYNHLPMSGWGDPRAWTGLILTLALAALAFRSLRARAWAGYGAWQFGLTFALSSNLVILVGATMAERFLFTPLLGVCMLWMGLLRFLERQWPSFGRYAFVGATLIFALPFTWKTLARNKDWESDERLFERQMAAAPGSARTWFTLGNLRYNQYLKESKAGADAEPDEARGQSNPVLQQAVQYFQKGLQIYDQGSVNHYAYGLAQKEAGDYAGAARSFKRAVELDSSHQKPWMHLGISLAKSQQWQEAIEAYRKAEQFDPKNLTVLKNIAHCYRQTNQPLQAVSYLDRALILAPNDKQILSQLVKVYRDDLKNIDKALYYNEKLK